MSSALIPAGHNSVMATRGPSEDGLDYFPTPPWGGRAGGEVIGAVDPGDWTCDEPACGAGHLVHGLGEQFATIRASDIADRGCGVVRDYLSPEADALEPVDWTVTNPPFIDGEAFVRTGLRRSRRGVALLLRLQFMEGIGRYALHHGQGTRLALVAPFAERVPMVKGRWDPAASSATAYAWFIWLTEQGLAESPMRAAIEACWAAGGYLSRTIPPGTRARLTRPSDFTLFAPQPDDRGTSLFGEPDE